MEVLIKGDSKEIADLISAVQGGKTESVHISTDLTDLNVGSFIDKLSEAVENVITAARQDELSYLRSAADREARKPRAART